MTKPELASASPNIQANRIFEEEPTFLQVSAKQSRTREKSTERSEYEEERNGEFLTLLQAVEPSLSRFTHAMTRDRESARDLAAETILIALEKFHTLQNKQAFLSFLLTIASRLYKKKQWRLRFWSAYDEHLIREQSDNNPGSQPDISTDVKVLYQALARLPANQREAVVLFEINGLSLEEIHTIQGGSLSGVKSRVARARQKLAQLLGVNSNNVP
jgi:RNA polymerase sigma-70 factor (ECF subfamily)